MELHLDSSGAERYHSGTQIARVLTERWTKENMYCPTAEIPTSASLKTTARLRE